MKALVKAEIFDAEKQCVYKVGEIVDIAEKRINTINAAYSGTLEKVKNQPKKK